jgi:hypothetical protein
MLERDGLGDLRSQRDVLLLQNIERSLWVGHEMKPRGSVLVSGSFEPFLLRAVRPVFIQSSLAAEVEIRASPPNEPASILAGEASRIVDAGWFIATHFALIRLVGSPSAIT